MAQHEPGERVTATIVKTSVREMGDKDVVDVSFKLPSDEIVSALIFLTQAAANMARGQLRSCGFDVDVRSLANIAADEYMLAGKAVELMSEEYRGKIQWRIVTAKAVSETRLFDYDAMLRAAKSRDAVASRPRHDEPPPMTDDDIPF